MESVAKAEVRDSFWHQDFANQRAVGRDAVHTIGGTTPDVALFINPESVCPARADLVKYFCTDQAFAICRDFEFPDVLVWIALSCSA